MRPQLFYVGVKALIFEEDKLLLVKKRDPIFWDMPGGRIDPGENILQAFKREMIEELPDFKDYEIDRLVGARKKEDVLRDGNGLFLIYFLIDSTSNNNDYTLSDEHTEHRFFSREDVSSLDGPLNRVYGELMDQVLIPGSNNISKAGTIIY